jgi:hypothetical protein
MPESASRAQEQPWNEAQGRSIVLEWKKSGLSAAKFAAAHGFEKHRLWYWSKRLNINPPEKLEFMVLPLATAERASEPPPVASECEARAVEVHLGQGVRVRMPNNFERGLLVDVLAAALEATR